MQRLTGVVFGLWLAGAQSVWAVVPLRPTAPASFTCPAVLPPIITGDKTTLIAGESVKLTASGCSGTVVWSTGESGMSVRVLPHQTTRYTAICRLPDGCLSCFADAFRVAINAANVPPPSSRLMVLGIPKTACAGQPFSLTATHCAGQVRWSDGAVGAVRTLTIQTATYLRAVCEPTAGRADSTEVFAIAVNPTPVLTLRKPVVQNACPYQTADLAQTVPVSFDPSIKLEFRTGPSPDAPLVSSVGAALAGTYYAVARSAEGCVSEPAAVSVVIGACANAIAPCLSNPPAASIRLDTLDRVRGLVCLQGRLRGSATDPTWTSTGTGLLTRPQPTEARYVASEDDRQRGTVTFAITTPDPDADGPCVGAFSKLTVTLSASVTSDKKDSTNIVVVPNTPETDGVFIPEGFSPNDDGVNDRFVIRGVTASTTVSLEVFNRWGHRVYVQDDYRNDWDGTANAGMRVGQPNGNLPDGTYFYVVRISDGREYVRFITISR